MAARKGGTHAKGGTNASNKPAKPKEEKKEEKWEKVDPETVKSNTNYMTEHPIGTSIPDLHNNAKNKNRASAAE